MTTATNIILFNKSNININIIYKYNYIQQKEAIRHRDKLWLGTVPAISTSLNIYDGTKKVSANQNTHVNSASSLTAVWKTCLGLVIPETLWSLLYWTDKFSQWIYRVLSYKSRNKKVSANGNPPLRWNSSSLQIFFMHHIERDKLGAILRKLSFLQTTQREHQHQQQQ